MTLTDDLLKELVELKKTELKRTRTHRTINFVLVTLPMVVILLVSIWGIIVLFQNGQDLLENFPDTMSDIVSQQMESIPLPNPQP
ncbi:hypothetical protein KKC94_01435 [Patescibacteria group bacterium]|nr:hypothetical protein [Patescibacteria group bacterium]